MGVWLIQLLTWNSLISVLPKELIRRIIMIVLVHNHKYMDYGKHNMWTELVLNPFLTVRLFRVAQQVTDHIAFYLPKNSNIDQVRVPIVHV